MLLLGSPGIAGDVDIETKLILGFSVSPGSALLGLLNVSATFVL